MIKRKKKVSIKKIVILLLIIFLLLFGFCISVFKNAISNNMVNNQVDDKIERETDKKTDSIRFIMVGDALINDYLYEDANRVANYNGYDFKPYLRLIKERVKEYDLAYYNQETILGGSSIGLSSYPAFNSPWEVGDAMIDTGFNLVSLATNHTLDRGEEAILLSREYWNKQENVYSVGSYSSSEEKKKIESQIYETNNIKYAILNYTYGTNGIQVPYGKDYLVNLWDVNNNYENYKDNVINDIENVRDKVDVLIVAMHWGVEYTHIPTSLQKDMANFLADNGVDIVIGTHPHVIEPVEWIGDTLVFYSLGNFISSQTSDSCTNYKCNIGLMSSLVITKDNDNIIIDNIENELIYTYNNNYTDYLVIPFSSNEIVNHLNNYKQVYEEYASIVNSDDDRIKTVSLVS